jgi:hypothetical protein
LVSSIISLFEKLPPEYSAISIVLAASKGAQAIQSITCSCYFSTSRMQLSFYYYWTATFESHITMVKSLLDVANRFP